MEVRRAIDSGIPPASSSWSSPALRIFEGVRAVAPEALVHGTSRIDLACAVAHPHYLPRMSICFLRPRRARVATRGALLLLCFVLPLPIAACRRTTPPPPAASAPDAALVAAKAPAPAGSSAAPARSAARSTAPSHDATVTLFVPAALPAEPAEPAALLPIVPVHPKLIDAPPTHFEPAGRLVAVCAKETCDVWERETGGFRGSVAQAKLAGWRESDRSLRDQSPDGRFALREHGEGGVALVRVANSEVVARAVNAKYKCRLAGAWKLDAARVAVPCGRKILALDADRRTASWSAEIAMDGHTMERGVWGDAAYFDVDVAARIEEPSERTPALFAWNGEDAAEGTLEGWGVTVSEAWGFDTVRGCVFARQSVCGCDCHESFHVRGCAGSDALAWNEFDHERPSLTGDFTWSPDGRAYAYVTTAHGDHCMNTEAHIVRIRDEGVDEWKPPFSSCTGGLDLALFGSGNGAVTAFRTDWMADPGGTVLEVARRGATGSSSNELIEDEPSKPSEPEPPSLRGGALRLSADERAVAVVAQDVVYVRVLDPEAKGYRWKGVTNARWSPRGALLAAEETGAGRVLVRTGWGATTFATPAGKRATLVGWAAKRDAGDAGAAGAARDALFFKTDEGTFEVALPKGEPTRRADVTPDEIAPAEPAPREAKVRPVSEREIVRVADGARMTLGDDHWYPRKTNSGEWDDLGPDARFLLGGDVLASALVEREQLDPLFVVPGLFRKFMRGDAMPPEPDARASVPPAVSVDHGDGGAWHWDVRIASAASGVAAGVVEIDRDGHVARMPFGPSPKVREIALPAGKGARVRACSATACSPWKVFPESASTP